VDLLRHLYDSELVGKIAIVTDVKDKNMKQQEWQLEITEKGEIFVQHLALPRFTMQIIIEGQQPNIGVRFKGKWIDQEVGGFDWYFKALEFYNNAPKK
jgi:hypothetical protein